MNNVLRQFGTSSVPRGDPAYREEQRASLSACNETVRQLRERLQALERSNEGTRQPRDPRNDPEHLRRHIEQLKREVRACEEQRAQAVEAERLRCGNLLTEYDLRWHEDQDVIHTQASEIRSLRDRLENLEKHNAELVAQTTRDRQQIEGMHAKASEALAVLNDKAFGHPRKKPASDEALDVDDLVRIWQKHMGKDPRIVVRSDRIWAVLVLNKSRGPRVVEAYPEGRGLDSLECVTWGKYSGEWWLTEEEIIEHFMDHGHFGKQMELL